MKRKEEAYLSEWYKNPHRKPLIIRGARQVGKSTVVRLFCQQAGIQLIELNEAFAAQYLSCERVLKFNRDIANVNGGAIALGHPVGATGTRIIVTLLHEMKRRNLTTGLASLCIGGGQGATIIFERI